MPEKKTQTVSKKHSYQDRSNNEECKGRNDD